MLAIIVSEEVALTEVVAALQRERLEATCRHFTARLDASLDRSAVHLDELEEAVALHGDLPPTEANDLVVVRDAQKGVVVARPPGPATEALARYAEQPRNDDLVVLDGALYTVALRPLQEGTRTLALAHPVADNLAALAVGKGEGIIALLSDHAVLALHAPTPQVAASAREALVHFLGLRPLPRISD